MRQRVQKLLVFVFAGLVAGAALAETFPSRPIRWIVPFAAGGPSDLLARLLQPHLSVELGQPVVVENRAGAAGAIGAQAAATAAPDGYTLLQVPSSFAANAALNPNLPYDSVKSFAPVAALSTSPFVLLVGTTQPFQNVDQLVKAAREKPGTLIYGSGGVGSGSHIVSADFAGQAKIDVVHVPYKGLGPTFTDLGAGRIHFVLSPLLSALPHIQAGKVRALAVSSNQRLAAHPGLPALSETFKGYQSLSWDGLLAPANTPAAVIDTLNKAIRAVVAKPEVRKAFAELELTEAVGSPIDFGQFYIGEIRRFEKVVKEHKIQLQ